MQDKEKVVKGLETCSDVYYGADGACSSCPYSKINGDMCFAELVHDAISLLKEQEPKTGKWILDDEDANSWECSECGDLLQINDGTPHENGWHFCPYCGVKLEEQAVKQND